MNSIGIQYKLCLRIDVQDSVLDWNESAQYEKKLYFSNSKSNHSSWNKLTENFDLNNWPQGDAPVHTGVDSIDLHVDRSTKLF